MKSFIGSAVLGAAVLSQVGAAASIARPHGHGHVHRRAPTSAPVAKREVAFMSPDDVDKLGAKGIKVGKNIDCAAKDNSPVTVGSDGGPFVFEFENKSPDDVVLVVWSGEGQWGAVSATFIGAQQPDITHTLQSNTSTTVSFNPDALAGKSISGGFGAIYPNGGLTPFSGQLDDTIGEFTVTTANQFSTTDVSRLINMNGSKMEIHNFKTKDDDKPACSSTMEKCVFVCDGAPNCMVGKIIGCPVGEEGTVSNESGMDGGCAGMSQTGGYVKVNFS